MPFWHNVAVTGRTGYQGRSGHNPMVSLRSFALEVPYLGTMLDILEVESGLTDAAVPPSTKLDARESRRAHIHAS